MLPIGQCSCSNTFLYWVLFSWYNNQLKCPEPKHNSTYKCYHAKSYIPLAVKCTQPQPSITTSTLSYIRYHIGSQIHKQPHTLTHRWKLTKSHFSSNSNKEMKIIFVLLLKIKLFVCDRQHFIHIKKIHLTENRL